MKHGLITISDLLVLSATPLERCALARDRLAKARDSLQFAEAHHSRTTQSSIVQVACVELRMPLDTNPANDEPLAAHWEDEEGGTRIVVHPVVDPETNQATPGCTIVLEGGHLDTRHHPLAPFRDNRGKHNVKDHIARAACAMDLMLGILTLACDPAKRMDRASMTALRNRLTGVAAAIAAQRHDSLTPGAIRAYAPNLDTPLRAIPIGSTITRHDQRDLLTDDQRKRWSAGLTPSVAIAERSPTSDSPILTLRVACVEQRTDQSPVEALRAMTLLPKQDELP